MVFGFSPNDLSQLWSDGGTEHRGRFLDGLTGGIWAVCEESGWQLPPHNNYVRDTALIPLPDTDRPVPDLFACETAAALSLICTRARNWTA